MSGQCKYVLLGNIPTKIIIYDDGNNKWSYSCDGGDSNQNLAAESSSLLSENTLFDYDRLIIMFSGFLGEIEYYHEFLGEIHHNTGIPLIGVSNSGHNRIPKHLPRPDIKKNPSLFSLVGQIEHKIAFLRKYVHPKTKLIMVGHSIACYIILEILNLCPDINEKIEHCVLLFPVIDRLIETKEAKFFHRICTTYYRPLIKLSKWLDRSLEHKTKEKIILKYMSIREKRYNLPPWVKQSATNLFDPYCLKALRSMALDQLRTIRTPRLEVIRKNAHKLTAMYAEDDRWVPIEYFRWIEQKLADCPDIDLRLCLGQIDHSLVIDSQETLYVARLTYKVIQNKWNL